MPSSSAEQQAIAAALSDADGVVAGLERVIAKKRLIKQGAMQDLLTARCRLPGFSGEWEVKRLGDLMSMKSGDAITSASIHEEGDYPVFGGNGLRGFTSGFNREGECTLVGRQGALCGAVTHTFGKIFASEHAIVCTATGQNCQRFISHRLEYADLNRVSESSAQPGLSVEKIKKIEIEVPLDGLEQKAIAAVLSDMDAEIQTLEARLTKARAVKEGMMQNLLTGRVRLV
jgi:type I restriction enzyme S subunit